MDHKKRFSQFIKNIKETDQLAVLYDSDADGICSAVITIRSLEKLGFKVERYIPCSHSNFNKTRLKELNKEGVNKIIILDFAGDQYGDELVNEVSVFDAVLLVDHHKIYTDINSDKIIFIKSQYLRSDLDGSNYCTSKMIFDLFAGIQDISDLDWLAGIGLTTDLSDRPWQDFLKKVYKKYDLNHSKLIDIGNVIDAGKQIVPPQIEHALQVVLEAKKPRDILKSPFSKIAKKLHNEVEFWINKFEEKAENKGDVWLYEIDPSASIGSVISTILALKYPDYVILVTRHRNSWVSINARNHSAKRPVNNLLEKAVKGLKGANAGGHKPAAGAAVREKDFEEFKKRIWKLA
jgi:single-stranded DNA-specific DHH superfamily exonuclease